MKSKVLVVDDDIAILRLIKNVLESKNFVVDTRTAIPEIDICHFIGYDLIILDIMMPHDGIEICKYIREFISVPIIFLTAKNLEEDIVYGIQSGADDYITKPFRPKELLSRIKNVLRRHAGHQTIILLDEIQVDTEKAIVKKKDTIINLSALEYKLLTLFIDHRGKLLTRDQLLDEIWNIAGDFVNDNTVTVYIKRLREKIEDDPTNPKIIKTVRGLGYRMD